MNNDYNNILYSDDYNNIKNNNKNKVGIAKQLSENEIITDVKLVNIDSRNRIKNSTNIVNKTIKCISNPLTFIKDENYIKFNVPNHNLNEGSKITINNVCSNIINLSNNNIIFTKNSDNLQFNYDITNNNINKYIDQHLFIFDIKCSDSIIGNINVNLLYGLHTIIYVNNRISIKLPYNFNGIYNSELVISFKLLNICGIPLNEINSDYPINNSKLDGFKNIVNVTKNTFDIYTNTKASFSNSNIGGSNIIIGVINNTINGYPNSNNYKIEMPILYNIKQISIISSDFPNTQYNITNNNNKLYINFLIKNNINIIQLEPGYYNIKNLINEINQKINDIQFVYYDNNEISNNNKYIKFMSLESNIIHDLYKDVLIFSININIQTINNIIYLEINDDKLLKINHVNHNLDIGSKILISNSDNIYISNSNNNLINAVPNNIINKEQIIYKIIDTNNYLIKLDTFNTISIDNNNNKINIVNIKYKLKFRLEFNKKDTFGNLIGFRNVGQNNSITHYHTEISNTTPYINELKMHNNKINIMQNNRIYLNPINYILLSCNFFYTNSNNNTNIKINNSNYITIAKIYLNNLGGVVYNNHINLNPKFDFIIQKLDNIEFIFHDRDYNLYDFGNIEHSFVLKFDIENILDKNTFINSQTGLSNVNTNKQKVYISNLTK